MAYNKETGMYEGYIYCIENTINNHKYIGQTRTTIEHRWSQHIRQDSSCIILKTALNKYGIENFIIYELEKLEFNNLDELSNALKEKEMYYIKLYNTYDGIGYNATAGGDTIAETRVVSVKQYLYNGTLVKQWDSVISAANFYDISSGLIIACCKGNINFCNGYVWRYDGDSFDKYKLTEESITRALMSYNIKQFDFDGNLIRIYTRNELVDIYKTSGLHQITLVCKGIKRFYKNYVWKFEFDDFKLEDVVKQKKALKNAIKTGLNAVELGRKSNGQIKPKLVNCYDQNDSFVHTYHSIQCAGESVGLKNPYSITLVCSCKRKYAGGYKWFYADDPNQPDKTKIMS